MVKITHEVKLIDYSAVCDSESFTKGKAANKPTYNVSEIEDLSDFISGEINDTNTTYKIEQDSSDTHKLILYSKEVDSSEWKPVSTITTADTIYDDTELNNAIAALKDLIGEARVAAQIVAALGALDKSDAAVGGQFVTSVSQTDGVVSVTRAALQASDVPTLGIDKITGLQTTLDSKASADTLAATDGKVATLIGNDTAKSVRTIANEELAAQLILEGAAESLNTLQEIAAWIQEHPDDASAMNSAITALQAQLTGINSGNGTVKAYVDVAIFALNIGDTDDNYYWGVDSDAKLWGGKQTGGATSPTWARAAMMDGELGFSSIYTGVLTSGSATVTNGDKYAAWMIGAMPDPATEVMVVQCVPGGIYEGRIYSGDRWIQF